MAEIKVTANITAAKASLTELQTAITNLSSNPIQIKVEGNFEKITNAVARVVAAQEKTKQAVEATKQAQISAAAAQATALSKVAVEQEKVAQAHEKAAQAAAKAAGQVAVQQEKTATEQAKAQQQVEKTAQAHEKAAQAATKAAGQVAVQQERTATEQAKVQQQVEKTAQAHEKTAQAAIKASAAAAKGASQAAGETGKLADAATRVTEAFTSWAQRRIWFALYNGLRQSLNTMKEMDSYLTTIQRVAGISSEAAGKYQEQAYDAATKYGVKPADYLANVVSFTRAGYGDLAGTLAEVATKMQVVGEVSADVATQMLLATDAAYGFEGNADKLSAVMDGVVAIGDNYATNIEKISEGIGIVASVASVAHVGIDELSAAIGTITATTQRSGTEAARALRSLFLNIIKDTKTEIEDGVTWTEDEIESFQQVLEHFIPDVLRAADAAGQVVNPMDALGALAQGIKEGIINEQELVDMVNQLGGKLRSPQLMSLLQNWDMYTEQVKTFNDAIGETDSKIDVALTSWQSKANMLSASFTKLFNNVLGSGMVKGGLTGLTAFIDVLNAFDGAPAKIIAVGTAFTVVSKAITSITAGGKLASLLSFFTNPAFLVGAGVATAIIGIKAAIDAIVVTQKELDEQAAKSAQEYETQKSELERITDELEEHQKIVADLESRSGTLTEAENARLEKEREITEELQRQRDIQQYKTEEAKREAAVDAAKAGLGSKFDTSGIGNAGQYGVDRTALGLAREAVADSNIGQALYIYSSMKQAVAAAYAQVDSADDQFKEMYLEQAQEAAQTEQDLRDLLVDHLDKQQKYYKSALDYAEENKLFGKQVLTTEEQTILTYINYYRDLLDAYGQYAPTLLPGVTSDTSADSEGGEGGKGGSDSSGGTGSESKLKSYAEAQAKVQKQAEALTAAMDENAQKSRITKETYDELTAAGFKLEDSVMQDGEAFVISAGKLEELRDDILKQCELWGFDVPQSLKTAADEAKRSMGEIIKDARSMADEANAAAQALANMQNSIKSEGDTGDTLIDYRKAYAEAMEAWQKGYYGSKKLTGFADIVFGPEGMASMDYDYEEAGRRLGSEFFEAMFAPESADDYGLEALKWLADNIGVKPDELGNLAYGFELVDGQIVAAVNDFDALAKALGMNKDTLMTLFDALGIYRNGMNTTKDDVKDMVDAMGDLSVSAEEAADATNAIDTQKFIDRLAAEGQTVSEIYKMLKTVRESGDYTLVGDKGGGQETIEQIQEAVKKANSKDFEFHFDTNQFSIAEEAAKTMVSNVTKTIEEAAGQWGGKLSVDLGTPTVNNTKVTEAEGTIETATEGISEDVTGLDNVSGTAHAYLNTDSVDEKRSVITETEEELVELNDAPGTGHADLDVEGAVEGMAQIDSISNDLENYDKLTPTAVAALETGEAVEGADLVSGIVGLLNSYGLLDPEAEAKLKAELADPVKAVRFAQDLLIAFRGDYTAEPGVDDANLSGDWESDVADAKERLEEYGVDYNAVIGLKNKIGEGEVLKLENQITEITALLVSKDLTVKLDTTDLSDAQKQQAIKDAQELLNDLRGTYTATAKLSPQGINAGTDALLTKINDTLATLDGTFNAIVEISGSALDDNSKAEAITQIKSDLAGLNTTFKVGIQVQSSIALQRVATMQQAIGKIKQGAESPITANITNAESSIATIQGKLDALAKGVVIPVEIVNARIPSKDVLVNGLGGFDKGYSPVRGTAETPEYYDPRTGNVKPARSVTTGGNGPLRVWEESSPKAVDQMGGDLTTAIVSTFIDSAQRTAEMLRNGGQYTGAVFRGGGDPQKLRTAIGALFGVPTGSTGAGTGSTNQEETGQQLPEAVSSFLRSIDAVNGTDAEHQSRKTREEFESPEVMAYDIKDIADSISTIGQDATPEQIEALLGNYQRIVDAIAGNDALAGFLGEFADTEGGFNALDYLQSAIDALREKLSGEAEDVGEEAGEEAGEALGESAATSATNVWGDASKEFAEEMAARADYEAAGQEDGEAYGAGYEAAMAGEEPPESVLFGDKGVTPAMAMEAGEETGTAYATGTVESIDQTLAAGEETLARTRSLVSEIMGGSTVSDTQAEVEGLSDAVADIPTPEPLEVDDSGVATAEAQVGELSGAIESIPDKTVTITINYAGGQAPATYSSISGGSVFGASGGTDLFRARAAGDRNFAGGISLVNELGPELISADGRAFIANGGAPGIVSLPRGAVIFTADETRSILTGGGIPAYASGTNTAAAALGLGTVGALAALISKGGGADWSGIFPTNPGNGGRGNGNGGNGNKNPPVDNTDYWAIIEAHYKDVTTAADMTLENLKYQIDLLKNAWDDEKKPIDEQIEALQDLNKTIDRQIELLGRERDKLTEPIQDEVDALKEAKDIQDDQLELAERQKAVEEARAELQNAQNERTIRFYNKETGHWEWMADQQRIQDAQEALEKAEKSLADYEYDLHIKELEAEIKAIEEDYQSKIDALNADKQANEDTIYDLEQQLRSIELKYEALIQPLEDQQADSDRALAAIKNAWSNAEEMRREHAEGDLDNAIAHEGESGALAGGAIKELQADLSTIAAAYKPAQQNNTLASLGIQFGASTGMYNPGNILTSIAGSSTDSHNIIINGLTMPASAAYQSLLEIAGDLAIYAGE